MHQTQGTYDRISIHLHRKSQFCLSTCPTGLSALLVWGSKIGTAAATIIFTEMQLALSIITKAWKAPFPLSFV